MTRFFLLLAAIVVGTLSPTSLAGIGLSPTPGNSWAFHFIERGFPSAGTWADAPFDTFAIRILTSGESFKSPAFTAFNTTGGGPSNWHLYSQTSTLAVAHTTLGNFGGELDMWTHLAGNFSTPLTMEYVAYNSSGTRLISQLITWDGLGQPGSLVFSEHLENGWNPGRQSLLDNPVPAPAAMALGLVGLSLIGVSRRRTP